MANIKGYPEAPSDPRTECDAAIEAGRISADLEQRVGAFAFKNAAGVEVTVPVMLDGEGTPSVFSSAISAANETNPPRAASFAAGDVASLVAWAKRYRTSDTIVYVAPDRATVVVDDVPAANSVAGSSRRHRGQLTLERHVRLLAWLKESDRDLSVEAFSDLVEANLDDLTDAAVPGMVRNLEIADATTWRRTVDDKGRIKLQSESAQGGTPVPRHFTTALPIWTFDTEPYLIRWRLALKVSKGCASFRFTPHDLDVIMLTRLTVLGRELAEALPDTVVLMGKP